MFRLLKRLTASESELLRCLGYVGSLDAPQDINSGMLPYAAQATFINLPFINTQLSEFEPQSQ